MNKFGEGSDEPRVVEGLKPQVGRTETEQNRERINDLVAKFVETMKVLNNMNKGKNQNQVNEQVQIEVDRFVETIKVLNNMDQRKDTELVDQLTVIQEEISKYIEKE